MFDNVLKASCEIIEYGWTKDRAPVDTFIMGLATSIREHHDYEEKVGGILSIYASLLCEIRCWTEKIKVD